MNKKMTFAMVAMVACMVLFAGCKKEYTVTFVNTTDQDRALQLTAPEEGTQLLGTLPAKCGKLKYDLKVEECDLPATCQVRANDITGAFTVTDKTPSKFWVDIVPEGVRVRDKKTVVNETRTSESKTMVSQDTVVE